MRLFSRLIGVVLIGLFFAAILFFGGMFLSSFSSLTPPGNLFGGITFEYLGNSAIFNSSSDTVSAEYVSTSLDTSDFPTGDDTLGLPYYRTSLSEADQSNYDAILSCMVNMNESASVSFSSSEALTQVFEFVMYDHPELFWVDTTFAYDYYYSDGMIYSFKPTYIISAENRDYKQGLIDAKVDEIISQISESDSNYNKALTVYRLLAESITYDVNAVDSQNIVSSLVNDVSACAGYAKAYQYILNQLDIPCIYVTGTGVSDGITQNHAWNIVCIDGVLTQVDVTWGDSVSTESSTYAAMNVDYKYFCLPDSLMLKDHTFTYSDIIPTCSSSDLLYSKAVNSYFDYYDRQSVYNRLYSGFCDGEESIYLQFANAESYGECLADIMGTQLVFDAASTASIVVNISSDTIGKCNIYQSEDLYCVIVTIDLNGNGSIG